MPGRVKKKKMCMKGMEQVVEGREMEGKVDGISSVSVVGNVW